MEFDGNKISELGVKKYLNAWDDSKFSNINPLASQEAQMQQWEKCNFGCHTPSYRVIKRGITKAQLLDTLDKASPLLAGFADGVHNQLVVQPEVLGQGVKRTGEGLGANGSEGISRVGAENFAAYQLVRVSVSALLTMDLISIANPIFQLIHAIIQNSLSLIPEQYLEQMLSQSALSHEDVVDAHTILSLMTAAAKSAISAEDIEVAASYLNAPGQRFVGKQIGKKVTLAVISIVSVNLTKRILRSSEVSNELKREIAKLRKSAKPLKGGLASALVMLLKTQGWLGVAASSSRKLELTTPSLWKVLRYDLNGLDMLLFLVEDAVQEYIDRIALAEKHPVRYVEVMRALARAGRTREIFFPE